MKHVYYVFSYPPGMPFYLVRVLWTREEAESKVYAEKLAGRVAWYNTVPLYKEKA